MARRAYNGYTEKSYYENKAFLGMLTTGDDTNEGYFYKIINALISDTSLSVKPRQGYLTTSIKDTNGDNITLSSQTIYYKDPRLNQFILIDLGTLDYDVDRYTVKAYRVELSAYNIKENYIVDAERITNLDITELLLYLIDNVTDLKTGIHLMPSPSTSSFFDDNAGYTTSFEPYGERKGILITDINSVQQTVFKLKLKYVAKDNTTKEYPFLMNVVYRKDAVTYSSVAYTADTLVCSPVYTAQQPTFNTISSDRNLASYNTIIPNPLQSLTNTQTSGFVNTFSMIYTKEKGATLENKRYLNGLIHDINELEIYPSFDIQNAEGSSSDSTYKWAFTYDIIDMSNTSSSQNTVIHEAPLYYLNTTSDVRAGKASVVPTRVNYFSTDLPTMFNTYDYYYNYAINYNKNFYKQYQGLLKFVYIYPKEPVSISIPSADVTTSNYGATYYDHLLETLKNKETEIYTSIDFNDDTIRSFQLLEAALSIGVAKPKDVYDVLTNHRGLLKNMLFSTVEPKDISEAHTYSKTTGTFLDPFHITGNGLVNTTMGVLKPNLSVTYTYEEFMKEFETDEHKCEAFMFILNPWSFTLKHEILLTDDHYNEYFSVPRKMFYNNLFPIENYTKDNVAIPITNNGVTVTCYKYTSTINLYFGLGLGIGTGANPLYTLYNAMHIDTGDTTTYKELTKRLLPRLNSVLYNSFIYTEISGLSGYKSLDEMFNELSIFNYDNTTGYLRCVVSDNMNASALASLKTKGYFQNGFALVFYLIPLKPDEHLTRFTHTTNADGVGITEYSYDTIKVSRTTLLNSTTYFTSTFNVLVKPTTPLAYMQETITEEPTQIKEAKNVLLYATDQGERLVTWHQNTVYISEPGNYWYFTYDMKKTFTERVIKVIQYKTILMVFTTQHLYAIYPYEETQTSTVTDKEGKQTTTTTKTITYLQQCVLYNILPSEKFTDVIQLFNDKVLYYTEEGQLYVITPSTTIDSETRFTLSYLIKTVNDVLNDYPKYINDRLEFYGINMVADKDDIKIKALVSINFIKIFYYVPNLYTMTLIYDVTNRYYYIYDTVEFSNIGNVEYIEGGEIYFSEHANYLHFTLPYTYRNDYENNVDMSVYNNFVKKPIEVELDTGNINLNNHLNKRFKTLRLTYKNIDANSLKYKLDTIVDSLIVYSSMESNYSIQNVNDRASIVQTFQDNGSELLDQDIVLFKFGDYTTNKIINHDTGIISVGKTIRFRLRFSSKGLYKILGYGILFKEHHV